MVQITMRMRSVVILVFLAICISVVAQGCCTFVDTLGVHGGGPRIYGGVRTDVGGISFVNQEWYMYPLIILCFIIDVPLSAAFDTLLLPYTIPFGEPR